MHFLKFSQHRKTKRNEGRLPSYLNSGAKEMHMTTEIWHHKYSVSPRAENVLLTKGAKMDGQIVFCFTVIVAACCLLPVASHQRTYAYEPFKRSVVCESETYVGEEKNVY